nr:hypothetical protein OG409_05080 [Streptomyces sp. NBC_00974]
MAVRPAGQADGARIREQTASGQSEGHATAPRSGRSRRTATLATATAVAAALAGCSSAAGTADRSAASPSTSPGVSPVPSAPASSPAAPSNTRSPQSTRSWPDVFTVIQKWNAGLQAR